VNSALGVIGPLYLLMGMLIAWMLWSAIDSALFVSRNRLVVLSALIVVLWLPGLLIVCLLWYPRGRSMLGRLVFGRKT
jgi:hypothetical protein